MATNNIIHFDPQLTISLQSGRVQDQMLLNVCRNEFLEYDTLQLVVHRFSGLFLITADECLPSLETCLKILEFQPTRGDNHPKEVALMS